MRLPWYCSKLKLYYCCSIKNVNEIVARSVEIYMFLLACQAVMVNETALIEG